MTSSTLGPACRLGSSTPPLSKSIASTLQCGEPGGCGNCNECECRFLRLLAFSVTFGEGVTPRLRVHVVEFNQKTLEERAAAVQAGIHLAHGLRTIKAPPKRGLITREQGKQFASTRFPRLLQSCNPCLLAGPGLAFTLFQSPEKL